MLRSSTLLGENVWGADAFSQLSTSQANASDLDDEVPLYEAIDTHNIVEENDRNCEEPITGQKIVPAQQKKTVAAVDLLKEPLLTTACFSSTNSASSRIEPS